MRPRAPAAAACEGARVGGGALVGGCPYWRGCPSCHLRARRSRGEAAWVDKVDCRARRVADYSLHSIGLQEIGLQGEAAVAVILNARGI